MTKGQELPVNGYSLKEGSTKPPKRYTSGSMVLAMENAGQLIEDEELRAQIKGSGIGTSATRAEIIKKLVRIGYLHLNKKSQILSPEVLGEMVYEVVNMTVPALLNPKMTASWEKGLDGITRGTVIMEDYREKLEDFIRKETLNMVERNLTSQLVAQIQPLTGKGARGIAAKKKLGIACPVCGAELVTTPFGYGCSNYKKDSTGCGFSIGTIAGRDLSEEEFRDLITKGRTDVLDGFVSKSKKKFPAALVLQKDEEGKINISFDFSANEPQVVEGIKCPSCGGDIVTTAYGFRCIHYDREKEDSCDFSVGKIAEKSLNVSQLTELVTNGRTGTIRGFKSKNGKRFDACLCLEKDENGNDVFVYRTTRHTERQKEGGCDWKVSGYFLVSPDIVNSEGIAKAQTMDWATANGYLTSANSNVYSTPSFAVTRGCAAYRGKDGLDETGTWRVPTRGECALILLFYKKMEETQETTGFQPFALSPKDLTYYWSATEKGGDSKDAWSMRLYADDKMTGYGLNTGCLLYTSPSPRD